MNQILLSEKVIETKEMIKKKKKYKAQFVLSTALSIMLLFMYVFFQFSLAKDKEAQDILANLDTFEQEEDPISFIPTYLDENTSTVGEEHEEEETETEEEQSFEEDGQDDVEQSEEDESGEQSFNTQKEDKIVQTTPSTSNGGSSANTSNSYSSTVTEQQLPSQTVTTQNGNTYQTNITINIPKINCNLPVLIPEAITNEAIEKALKSSCVKFWGPEINEVGNYCIVGHNYRNSKFFSKLNLLESGDIVQITDLYGNVYNYKVYDQFTVDPNDNSCTDQRTNGRRELTLITCTNDARQRFIVKCVAI